MLAPFAILAMASTPSVLSGGIDLTIGPLSTVINCVLVTWLLPHGWGPVASVAVLLAMGAAVGAMNGLLIGKLRYQPVVADALRLLHPGRCRPEHRVESVVGTRQLDGPFGGKYWLLSRSAHHNRHSAHPLGAAWSHRIPAHPVRRWRRRRVRLLSRHGRCPRADHRVHVRRRACGSRRDRPDRIDPDILRRRQLAVRVAGICRRRAWRDVVAGGRGGMFTSLLGAFCIFMITQLLSSANVGSSYEQVVYGALLIVGVVVSTRIPRGLPLRRAAT